MREEFMVRVIEDATGEVVKESGPYGLRKAEALERSLDSRVDQARFTVVMEPRQEG